MPSIRATSPWRPRVNEAVRALHDAGMCKREEGKLYGKSFTFPGDQLLVTVAEPLEYRFSGGRLEAVTADSAVLTKVFDIANSLAEEDEKKFKAVLVNVYRERNDSVSMHRDKDVKRDEKTGVVCISVGDKRIIRFKADPSVPGAENYAPCTDIEVCGGEVYVMKGLEFQRRTLHACLAP